MGAADVVPGVSGGTIAFISGIYQELIDSINNVNISALKTLKKRRVKSRLGTSEWKFFIGVGNRNRN